MDQQICHVSCITVGVIQGCEGGKDTKSYKKNTKIGNAHDRKKETDKKQVRETGKH